MLERTCHIHKHGRQARRALRRLLQHRYTLHRCRHKGHDARRQQRAHEVQLSNAHASAVSQRLCAATEHHRHGLGVVCAVHAVRHDLAAKDARRLGKGLIQHSLVQRGQCSLSRHSCLQGTGSGQRGRRAFVEKVDHAGVRARRELVCDERMRLGVRGGARIEHRTATLAQ